MQHCLSIILFAVLLLGVSCKQSDQTRTSTPNNQPAPAVQSSNVLPTEASNAPAVKPAIDACALLTSQEIESIQGKGDRAIIDSPSRVNPLHSL